MYRISYKNSVSITILAKTRLLNHVPQHCGQLLLASTLKRGRLFIRGQDLESVLTHSDRSRCVFVFICFPGKLRTRGSNLYDEWSEDA